MPVHAVLTGDIVNSTQLTPAVEKQLVKALQQVLEPYKFEFYRGDSFQVYMKTPAKALQAALLCRTAALRIAQDEESVADVRIAIGLGDVTTPVRTLASAKGDAFILSGRALDAIQKTSTRLAIDVQHPLGSVGLQVIADYVNAIFDNMTAKQAEVIFELLKGATQQKVATDLNKSKSTISQIVSSGRWNELEKLLQQFEHIINLLA